MREMKKAIIIAVLCFAWFINLQTPTRIPNESGTTKLIYVENYQNVKIDRYDIKVYIHGIWVEIPMSNVASFWWAN